ncbi:ATP-binding protein [Saccharopolyspora dendranthemae]|uniref:histidine kinase n=1 Tax=Saccharopolyspora dendranthemae TaxID=1181886 RepID=A0A561U7H3_9PSEU|nr:sensor histidine kinase [Saccharopolyspora dendranthemae]TWF95304.1 histidine kinase/DNA gyrase B/HSP90-like ATPase [Saccharopolyspora dendranthemae]
MKLTRNRTREPDRTSLRRRIRNILITIVVLFFVVVLAGFAPAFVDGLIVRTVALTVQDTSIPAVRTFTAVQSERQLVARAFSGEGAPDALGQRYAATDQTIGELSGKLTELSGNSATPPDLKAKIDKVNVLIGQLPESRPTFPLDPARKTATLQRYNEVLDAGADLFGGQARAVEDAPAGHAGISATEIFRSGDQMARTSVLADRGVEARMSPDEQVEFAMLVGSYRDELEEQIPHSAPQVQQSYQELTRSASWGQLQAVEQQLITRGQAQGVTTQQWHEISDEVGGQITELAVVQARYGSDLGLANGNAALLRTTLFAGLVLIATAGAAVLMWWFAGRQLVALVPQRLVELRDAVRKVADEDVPELFRKVERGEEVDVSTPLRSLDFGKDEIGDVADAFADAYQVAVQERIKQKRTSDAFTRVVVGMAARVQQIVQNAMQIVDTEEREAGEAAPRYRALLVLDSLLLRARRLAENLRLLSGNRLARYHRGPTSMEVILESARAEIEHYGRIHTRQPGAVAVDGQAAPYLIRVLAELMDNAANYSSPQGKARVWTEELGGSLVVVIEDRGLGMPSERLGEANEILATDSDFALGNVQRHMQLGLPVVARITQQWSIQVRLAAGESGGIRAEVAIPAELVREVEVEKPAPAPISSARGTLSGATALLADPVETRAPARPEPKRPRVEPAEQEQPLETSPVGLPMRRKGASPVGRALDEEKKAQGSGAADEDAGTRRNAGGGGAMGFVSGRQNHGSDTGEG